MDPTRRKRIALLRNARVLGGLGLLVLGLLGSGPLAAQTAVGVRCAEHGAFYRVVFDLPRDAGLTVQEGAGSVRVPWQEGWTLQGVEACLRTIQGLAAVERSGDGQVRRHRGATKIFDHAKILFGEPPGACAQ